MKNDFYEKTIVGSLAGILFAAVFAVLILYGAWAWAFVADYAFDWFMSPMFPSLPNPTLTQLLALAVFLGVILPKGSTPNDDNEKDKMVRLLTAIVFPWLTLGCLWFLQIFFKPGVYLQ